MHSERFGIGFIVTGLLIGLWYLITFCSDILVRLTLFVGFVYGVGFFAEKFKKWYWERVDRKKTIAEIRKAHGFSELSKEEQEKNLDRNINNA